MKKRNVTAILLAAGTGRRMGPNGEKLYLELSGKPVLYYSLKSFEESDIDRVILMVRPGQVEYVRNEIVNQWGFHKVALVLEGGKERYQSVHIGLKEGKDRLGEDLVGEDSYVLIHDAARAFTTPEMINRCIDQVIRHKACIMGVPAKDTIRMVDKEAYSVNTPPRSCMWIVQTPQCFVYGEILEAFEKMMEDRPDGITDDGMVMERYGSRRVLMIEGSYDNIKITTKEDLITGEAILRSRLDG